MMIKGGEHLDKEADTPELLEQQADMPEETNPEPSKASLVHTIDPNKEIEMQENFEVFKYLAEAMAKCLLDDTEMRSLLSAAMSKLTNERSKNNLAYLLTQSAEKLTKDFTLEAVANFVSMTPSDDQDYY